MEASDGADFSVTATAEQSMSANLMSPEHVARFLATGVGMGGTGKETSQHHECDPVIDCFYERETIEEIFTELRGLVTTIWILIASVQIVTMQMGFAFFEVGAVQHKNKTNILLKNLLGTFIGMIGYYFMGFAIANYANGGLVGNGPFFCLGINTEGLLKFVF